MNRRISIFSCLFILTLFSNCKKETVDYNQKANEVIQKIIIDEKCGCIIEISTGSMISENHKYNPIRDVKTQLIEKLKIRDRKELDSLERLSENFILDSTFIRQHKIRIVPLDSLKILADDPNFCKNGILSLKKPFFDKEYKKAVIDYKYAFMCLSPLWAVYEYKDGKWKK